MIRDVIMPQLAMGMSEGTIVEWAVEEGESVAREAKLLAIETEKVVTEIPAPYAGWLHRIGEVGKAIPVETVIAKIADSEAEYRTLLANTGAGTPTNLPASLVTIPTDNVAQDAVLDAPTAGSRPEGRVRASGLAKKTASDHGLDLACVTGSGPGGRIEQKDVLAALESQAQKAPPVATVAPSARAGEEMRVRARVPMTGMRKAIADRLMRSKITSAHTYAFFEVDITKLVAVRSAFLDREKELQTRISMTALYAKALAIVLSRVPNCNATLVGEEILIWESVNIGIAVALPGRTEYESGLVVPVVRNVERKGVIEIDREIKALAEKARTGRLTITEMSDGTVTLSSTAGFSAGQWCVSAPLLNQPQVLNFQPGSPIEKPVVIDGQVVIRTMLPCGLSYDHRALDGEPMARFGRAMSELLANPELMLL